MYFLTNYLSFESKVNFLYDNLQRGNLGPSYAFVEEKEYAHTKTLLVAAREFI